MKISVVALGKIGLPLAVQFASMGHEVVGVDIQQSVVDLVNAVREPFPLHWPSPLAPTPLREDEARVIYKGDQLMQPTSEVPRFRHDSTKVDAVGALRT